VAYAESDPEMEAPGAFRQGLKRLGWWEGRKIRIDTRFAPAGAGQEQLRAQEPLLRSCCTELRLKHRALFPAQPDLDSIGEHADVELRCHCSR
jgi:hypothetical protein